MPINTAEQDLNSSESNIQMLLLVSITTKIQPSLSGCCYFLIHKGEASMKNYKIYEDSIDRQKVRRFHQIFSFFIAKISLKVLTIGNL